MYVEWLVFIRTSSSGAVHGPSGENATHHVSVLIVLIGAERIEVVINPRTLEEEGPGVTLAFGCHHPLRTIERYEVLRLTMGRRTDDEAEDQRCKRESGERSGWTGS